MEALFQTQIYSVTKTWQIIAVTDHAVWKMTGLKVMNSLILQRDKAGCSDTKESLHTKLGHLPVAVISMLHNHLLIPVHLQSMSAEQDLLLAFYFS